MGRLGVVIICLLFLSGLHAGASVAAETRPAAKAVKAAKVKKPAAKETRVRQLEKRVQELEHRLRIMEQVSPLAISKWAMLRKGMQTKEVIRLLGGPVKIVRTHTIFVYPDGGMASFDVHGRLQRWQLPAVRRGEDMAAAGHQAWTGWVRPLRLQAGLERQGALIAPRERLEQGRDTARRFRRPARGVRHAGPHGWMRPNQGWGSGYR